MKYPKLWDGASPVGEALVRAQHRAGGDANSSYGVEVHDNGMLGTVRTKTCGNSNDVYRSPDTPTGEPFLGSWPEPKSSLMDRVLPHSVVAINMGNLIGNGCYIGGGHVACAEYTRDPTTADPIINVLLVARPQPNQVVTLARYREVAPAARSKFSVRLGVLTANVAKPSGSTHVQFAALGWDGRAYVFAVLVCDYETGPPTPFVYVCNTVDLELVRTSFAAPSASDTDFQVASRMYSPSPGRLEIIYSRPSRIETVSTEERFLITLPFAWTWGVRPDYAPPLVPPSGWGPGDWERWTVPDVGSAVDKGRVESITYTYTHTTNRARATVAIAASADFGATWTFSDDLELSGRQADSPAVRPAGATPGRSVAIPSDPYSTLALSVGGTIEKIITRYTLMSIEYTQTDYRPTATDPTPLPDVEASTFGIAYVSQRLNHLVRRGSAIGAIVGAGESTFLAFPRYHSHAAFTYGPGAFSVVQAIQNNGLVVGLPYQVTNGTGPRFSLQMFRRTGAGGYSRVAWPLDEFPTTLPQNVSSEPVFPNQTRYVTLEQLSSDGNASNRSWACASAGEGCALFCVTAGDGVLAVATTDNGASWTTLAIADSDMMDGLCVLEPEGRETVASYLYASKDPTTGKHQLMKLTADLSKRTPYGGKLAKEGRGLTNFRKYIQPGFPGLYDGPDAQPRTRT